MACHMSILFALILIPLEFGVLFTKLGINYSPVNSHLLIFYNFIIKPFDVISADASKNKHY